MVSKRGAQGASFLVLVDLLCLATAAISANSTEPTDLAGRASLRGNVGAIALCAGREGGMTITLYAIGGGMVSSATTSIDGYYLFSPVAAGTYIVSLDLPDGLVVASTEHQVVVASDASATANFALQIGNTVGGSVYRDLNGHGILNQNETGLSGVRVTLKSLAASRVMTTSSGGRYQFLDVPPGVYVVTEYDPEGFFSIANTKVITMTAGGSGWANFGDRPGSTVSGNVFYDSDLDQAMGNNEPGFGGAQVILRDDEDVVIAATTAQGNGSYAFPDIAPGAYTVAVVEPAGFLATTAQPATVLLGLGNSQAASFGLWLEDVVDPPSPDLTISKTVTPTTDVAYHGIVTYTVVLNKSGVLSDTDVTLTDELPAEVDFAGWVISPTNTVLVNDTITWTGTITADEALTWTWQAMHTGDYTDVVTNTVVFTGSLQTGGEDATFTITLPFYGVTITPPVDAQSVDPDSTVVYTHVLENTGNAIDTYTIEAQSSRRWTAEPSNITLQLGAESTATVRISITVPSDALDGVVDTTIITATSQADSEVWDTAIDTTTVVSGCVPLRAVGINGPTSALSGTMISLSAVYTPTQATGVTLLWDNGTLGHVAEYTWASEG